MRTNIFIALAVLYTLIFSVAGCGNKISEYDAEGSFEADEVIVSAEATGKLLSFDVDEGDFVEPGAVLGRIDSTQLYLSKLQLMQSFKAVRSNSPDVGKQTAAVEDQLKKARTEYGRIKRMFEDKAATSKQVDDAESQVKVLESQLDALYSSLTGSKSSIDAQGSSIGIQIAQIDDMLAKCRISSLVGGTVVAKYVHAGELVTAGKPLFKVADLDEVYLRAYFTSEQLSKIRLGMKVKVFADFGGGQVREYEGFIKWISPQGEFTPKNIHTQNERAHLAYAVKIGVKNDGYIKLGLYGGVEI